MSWMGLLGLGALHGLNPGMGWLFAVALGFQERSARAVWRALPPLALGHALAVGAAVAGLALLGAALPQQFIKYAIAASLIGLGIARLRRHRHPNVAGMRAGPRELVLWSFLMASAHGAGLMVLPLVGDNAAHQHGHAVAAVQAGLWNLAAVDWAAPLLHTAGYLLTVGLIAWLVYAKLGLRKLTSLWINVDAIWAGVLVLTGLLVGGV